MPFKRIARPREPLPSGEQEEAEPAVKRPIQELVEAGTSEPGRPHQAFVESKLRQYLRDNEVQSLVKPTQAEVREAAMPILCMARRRRLRRFPLEIAHRSAAAMEQHAMEKGWIKPPYFNPYQSQSHIDALIQLIDKLGWLAKEIPLPAHAEPHHPTIFYTVEKKGGFPYDIPREDSLIRADYVHTLDGQRISGQKFIHPWPILKKGFFPEREGVLEMGWDVCYTMSVVSSGDTVIQFHWAVPFVSVLGEPTLKIFSIRNIHFGPQPPS